MTRDQRELALAEALYGLVCEHCRGAWPTGNNPGLFGSGCSSSSAEALHSLAAAGILVITDDDGGRVVVARDTDPPWDCERMPEAKP